MPNYNTFGERLLAGAVLDFGYFRAVRMARMVAVEIGHVIIGLIGNVAGQGQFHDEDTPPDLPVGVHVGDIPHQQVAIADIEVIFLVPQLLQVRAKT
jgi:hypothetical protein